MVAFHWQARRNKIYYVTSKEEFAGFSRILGDTSGDRVVGVKVYLKRIL